MDTNRFIQGDCADAVQCLPADSVDLVYLDPPFNTGKHWLEFDDRWTRRTGAAGESEGISGLLDLAAAAHSPAMGNYLAFMADRLAAVRRIMRNNASIYLHCDTTSGYYLRTKHTQHLSLIHI